MNIEKRKSGLTKKKVLILILIIILGGEIVIKSNLNHKNNPKQENELLKGKREQTNYKTSGKTLFTSNKSI